MFRGLLAEEATTIHSFCRGELRIEPRFPSSLVLWTWSYWPPGYLEPCRLQSCGYSIVRGAHLRQLTATTFLVDRGKHRWGDEASVPASDPLKSKYGASEHISDDLQTLSF